MRTSPELVSAPSLAVSRKTHVLPAAAAWKDAVVCAACTSPKLTAPGQLTTLHVTVVGPGSPSSSTVMSRGVVAGETAAAWSGPGTTCGGAFEKPEAQTNAASTR